MLFRSLSSFLRRSILPFTSSVFLCFLGIIGTIVCIGALFLKKKILPFFILSFFSFWVGMGVLTNTDLIQIFSSNFTINSYLEYAALYASALSLILFFVVSIAQSKFEKISSIALITAFSLFCIVSIILERMNIIHIHQTLSYYQIICSAMMVFGLIISIQKIITKNGRILFSSLSFTFLIFFCILDLSRYIIQKYFLPTYPLFYTSLLTIGVIIFIISELLFYFTSMQAEIIGLLSVQEHTSTPPN